MGAGVSTEVTRTLLQKKPLLFQLTQIRLGPSVRYRTLREHPPNTLYVTRIPAD